MKHYFIFFNFLLVNILPQANGASDFIDNCIDTIEDDSQEEDAINFFKIQCESSEDCPDNWTCEPAIGICFISTQQMEYELDYDFDYAVYNAPNVQKG